MDSVKVFPNPARQYLEIKLPPNTMLQEYEIYNLIGQHIDTRCNLAAYNDFLVDVSGLTNGSYYIVMNISGNTIKRKFLKR